MNKAILVVLVILVVGGGIAYWSNVSNKNENPILQTNDNNISKNNDEKKIEDDYCTKNGGTVKTEKRPSGSEYRLCYFDDNRACEEEAMKSGECPIGGVKTTGYDNIYQRFCAWSGGSTIAETNARCTFKDGSYCSTEEYYFETCHKGAIKVK